VPIVASQLGQWAPIAAEQTASGYEVALKVTGADQYTVWYTDGSGNYLSTALNGAPGASAALQSFEASFHQDLNGDGLIGSSSTAIESFGSTSLVQVGINYFLNSTGGSSVELSYGGSPVVAGQFGLWTPIAAEQTASGYEVALKVTGADQYTVWYTDSSGNYVSSAFNSASGTSATVESFETSFQQDLNGDGLIGPPTTVIENFGSTSLVQTGSSYFLKPAGGSSVELSYVGAPVVAGQFGLWTPIGAEQTPSGYEVAWKAIGADQYTVWNTDSSGNYVSSAFNTLSGTSAVMESLEPSFQQDLNGDGVIGMRPLQFVYQGVDANGAQVYSITAPNSGLWPIEVRVLTPDNPSTNYEHNFLYALPVEGGTNPTLGDGLNELEKLHVQDQYNATIIEPIFPTYSWYANSATDVTEQYETFMATVLPEWVDSNFSISGTENNLLIGFSKSGYGGLDLLFKHPDVFSAVSAWDFPADMTSYTQYTASMNYGTEANFQNNYRLTADFIDTYKAPFTTEDRIFISGYSLFKTDVSDFNTLLTSHGVQHEYLSQQMPAHSWTSGWLSNAVTGLYGLETDLTQATIENAGSTSLVQGGSNYFLYPNGGSEVELKYTGAAVVAGQFDQDGGPWTPIGAEQTASGYEVAWKVTGADQFMVWNIDNSGNFVSKALTSTSGASAALQSMEISFKQDLNGDGYLGLVLNGSSGGQTLTAGNNPTTLIGGPGDTLNGGAAADNFVFKSDFGSNTVNNFTPGTDTLQFSQSMFANAATVLGDAQQVGSDVVIAHDALDVVTLHNVPLANLHASDFHLV
jgi:20S proteasome alpha/beta subunit